VVASIFSLIASRCLAAISPGAADIRLTRRPKELGFDHATFASGGVIAEFVPKCTLSSIEERGAGISQRPKPILERFGRPDVVAIKTDVFPAEWSDVRQQRVGQNFALDAKLGEGVAEIDGVPEGDGGDREAETRGPIALVFEGAVPDLAVTMEKQARASVFWPRLC
jgi:hypothetical protein